MSSQSRIRLAIILPVVVILVAASTYFALRKTVTLSIDGEARGITTFALTVGSLLHEQGITLSPLDDLSLPQDAWLKNGIQVTLQHAIPVQILDHGDLVTIYSSDRAPLHLIAEAGVVLLPDDLVMSNGRVVDPRQPFPTNAAHISLQIVPSTGYSLTEQGETQSLSSPLPTLGSALWAAGISIYAADDLEPSADTPLLPGLSAVLTPSNPLVIQTQDGVLNLRTAAKTVGEALSDANLSLQGLDYSLPPADSPLPVSGVVKIVRVVEDVLVEQSPLPFETQYQPADDVQLDSQSVVQAGEYGLTAQRVRVRYENGIEISRQVEGQWVARQPVPRIIGYGTLVTMQTELVDGVQVQYWRKLNMYATSYHPSEVGSTTASGLPLQKGVAAVDINYVPFYTQMYVPGYGEVVAADIGGGVVGRWIDLGYSDNDYVPWHEWVTVYFLWPPPANIVWVVP